MDVDSLIAVDVLTGCDVGCFDILDRYRCFDRHLCGGWGNFANFSP